MEKRIHSHLLLQGRSAADITVDTWSNYFLTMAQLTGPERLDATAEARDEALMAATVDASSQPQARAKYIKAMVSDVRPFFDACTNASVDPFLAANDLLGPGALSSIEQRAANLTNIGAYKSAEQP